MALQSEAKSIYYVITIKEGPAKALEELTNKERSQLFGYMVGTGFPIGILVNFATYPIPTIERYYFDKKDMTLTAF